MRAVRRVLASPLPHRTPVSIGQRACISSATSTSPRHTQPKPRGRALNSSLAIDSGHHPNLIEQGFFPGRPTNTTPSNHTPNPDSFHNVIPTPLTQYQKLIDSGVLRGDEHQTRIIQKLQDLHDKLLDYNPLQIPDESSSNSLLSRLFSRESAIPTSPPESAPKGLYLYGDVGTGKTMLMDLFYQTLPPSLKRKRRVHFHAFMIDVHKRLHAAKIAMGFQGGDPIVPVARDLAREASILCFDEFQVTDIADAMILRRLLEALVNYGVVCVMTSNRHPDDLYKNGIQRSSFVPAIELLKAHFEVTDLDSGTDYRRVPRALSHVYYSPLTTENNSEINKIFNSLASEKPDDPPIHNRKLNTWGRTILIPESTSTVAKFDFNDLCGQPLSAADYIEITETFGTVFVFNIPKMAMDQKDLARRFITFIDACYESKTKLFVTSEVPVFQVFSDNPTEDTKRNQISDQMRSVMDDLGLNHEVVGASSMFTGEEEVFAFARACSRLVQMGSREWAETAGQKE
ncbi:hypothetical protein GALMADRAFT_236577 [Galerina marginata CBS 339.88]|uniref:AAA+ ATPase domain-containing protein n=1 Tax=Galerina marginata (strain CBS 339.88) TaxID=685588 RepID=A0A067TLJ6_GALM3|nr:hypothetical protein GALMADRAFT_236577 [Galerina marginata CBS 339.88]